MTFRVFLAVTFILMDPLSALADSKTLQERAQKLVFDGTNLLSSLDLRVRQNRAASKKEESSERTPFRDLIRRTDTASQLVYLNRTDEALKEFTDVLARFDRSGAGETVLKTFVLLEVADIHIGRTNLTEAESFIRTAREQVISTFGRNNALEAIVNSSAAKLLVAEGRHEAAITLIENSFDMTEKRVKLGKLSVLYGQRMRFGAELKSDLLYQLGRIQFARTNFAAAEASLRAASSLNGDEPELALAPANLLLARACFKQGRSLEAGRLLKEHITRADKDPNGFLAAAAGADVLQVCAQESWSEQATNTCDHLLKMDRKSQGEGTILLAAAHFVAGREENDASFFIIIDQAIAAHQRQFGADNEPVIAFYQLAAGEAQRRNVADRLLMYLEKQVGQIRKHHGESDRRLAEAHKTLIDLYGQKKDSERVDELHQEQIKLMRTLFGNNDSRLANTLEDYGIFLAAEGRTEEAKKCQEEANRVRVAAITGR